MRDEDDRLRGSGRYAAAAGASNYDAVWTGRLGLASVGAVRRLDLRAGERVLDAACGAGGAALLAAQAVGPGGPVAGIDLSPAMLALARQRARAAGARNLFFQVGDMARLPYRDRGFDAVLCILGLFFAPDMEAQAAELWRVVAPGGRLAVAVLGGRWFAPMSDVFLVAVRDEDPAAQTTFYTQRVNTEEGLAALMARGGVPDAAVSLEPNQVALASAGDWWGIVTGTVLHQALRGLAPEAVERVRERCAAHIAEHAIDSLALDFIYAVARNARR